MFKGGAQKKKEISAGTECLLQELIEPSKVLCEEAQLELHEAEESIDRFYDDKLYSIENSTGYGNVSFNVTFVSVRLEELRHLVTDLQLLRKAVYEELNRIQYFVLSSEECQRLLVKKRVTPAEADRTTLNAEAIAKLSEARSQKSYQLEDRQARDRFVQTCLKQCDR